MNREQLNVAVIGLGQWGPNYVRILNSFPEVRVAAVSDVAKARRDRLRPALPDTKLVGNYRRLLSDPDLDAVVVATPTSTHYRIVKDSLMACKHVLCEKPLTCVSAEAWELTGIARDRHLQLMTGHVFLFNPGILCLDREGNNPITGRVYYLNSVRTNLGPFRSDVNAGWDLASHDIYIFNHILRSRPESVSAAGASYLRDPIEDIVFLTLRYPCGILGHIHISWLDPKKVRQITLVGENRMITWDEYGAPGPVMIYERKVVKDVRYDSFGEFRLLANEGDVVIPSVPSYEPLAEQAREFVRRCVSGRSDGRGAAVQAAEVVDVLTAATESLRADGAFRDVKYGEGGRGSEWGMAGEGERGRD